MTGEEIEAIVNGYHGDAFGILGPHSVRKKKGPPRWEVRAFLPQADAAAVVVGGTRYEMEKKHAQGDRKSTRLNSSHRCISYAVFCLKKKKKKIKQHIHRRTDRSTSRYGPQRCV